MKASAGIESSAKNRKKMIGDCGILKLNIDGEILNDLGYIIHHAYCGRGYATEAASAVKWHAFDVLKLNSLHANMACDHGSSKRVAEKLGMRKIKEFVNEKNNGVRTFLYAAQKNS